MNPQIERYTKFIDKLKEDLSRILEKRDAAYSQISDCCKLQAQLTLINSQEQEKLQTKINVGCDFFMDAVIPDTSKIVINVGLGYFVEMDSEKAETFLEKKKNKLEEKSKSLTSQIANIRSHIKVVLRTIHEVFILF